MLGIGAMQGIGRIGCFMVGCCHGRPARIGFRYSQTHSRYGFPRRLLDLRLFPVQLVESAWVLFSVGVGVALVLRGASPGAGLSAYLVLFAAGRFCLEVLRGDRWRRQFGYFSEAQWVSYAIVAGVCLLGWAGLLPFQIWHGVVLGGLNVMAAMIAYRRYTARKPALDDPQHRTELLRALSVLAQGSRIPAGDAVHLRTTSAGVQVSLGQPGGPEGTYHYTLSSAGGEMNPRDARILANMIYNWHPHPGKATLVREKSNVFHLIRYRDGAI